MDLKIEKMIYGGNGLARMPVDSAGRSKTVFVPFVLPGEGVSAVVTEEKSGFNRAEAGRIISPSPHRIAPECKYFYRCGGCHYQHTDYANQIEIKTAILLETLKRTARIDWTGGVRTHPSPPWNYRNRTRLHVQDNEFALGYHKINSHDLLPVEECPISSPLINKAIAMVWKLGRAGKMPKSIHQIEFFANVEDEKLLVEVYSTYEPESQGQTELQVFAEKMATAMPEIVGTSAFATGGSLFPWDSAAWTYGGQHLVYRTKHGDYRVQAGSFFQVNRFLTDDLVNIVTSGRSGGVAYDFYSGTGLFSVPLAKHFERVVAVESSPSSFGDLQVNAPSNVEGHRLTIEEFLRQHGRDEKPDLIVLDPPRAGIEEKIARALIKAGAPQITYVSCDPATLSRDLKVLIESGYRVEEIHMVDLFPQTFHLESVVHLTL